MTENTEIALHQRAVVAIGYEKTVAELEQLAAKSADIVEITNADGYNQVHQARVQLKFTRIDIEKKGKAAREDATRFRDAVIAYEKELIGLIKPEEKRLEDLQGVWDAAKEREKAERLAAEMKRRSDIEKRIIAIRDTVLLAAGGSADLVKAKISEIEEIQIDESFQEFAELAATTKHQTLLKLDELHIAKMQAEEEAANLKAEREEMERQRAELAEQERISREQQAERDRVAREQIEAERAAIAERDRLAREELEAQRADIERQRAELEASKKAEDPPKQPEDSPQQAEVKIDVDQDEVPSEDEVIFREKVSRFMFKIAQLMPEDVDVPVCSTAFFNMTAALLLNCGVEKADIHELLDACISDAEINLKRMGTTFTVHKEGNA